MWRFARTAATRRCRFASSLHPRMRMSLARTAGAVDRATLNREGWMTDLPQAMIGVIGGSGLYQMGGLSDVQEVRIETPFGAPSDAITVGRLGDVSLAFLPRHGRGHRLNPTEVP